MQSRAYSLLEVKEFDDGARVIRGIATSPRPDRMGDIVEADGIEVADSIPLFLNHDSQQVVGRASLGKAGKDGRVPFEATLPDVKEAGVLADRIAEAWQLVRYKLIQGVSIGFRAIEYAFLKEGGIHFLKSEVLELSLVPVPAQPDAVIQGFKACDPLAREQLLAVIKQADSRARASLSHGASGAVRLTTNRPASRERAAAAITRGFVQLDSRK